MSPETFETLKQATQIGAGAVVTAALTWAGMREKARRERRAEHKSRSGEANKDRSVPPGYTLFAPPPDDTPRTITHREWHRVVGLVEGARKDALKLEERVGKVEERLDEVNDDLQAHKQSVRVEMAPLVRLQADFEAFMKSWDAQGRRTETDRKEIREDLASIRRKLDEAPR